MRGRRGGIRPGRKKKNAEVEPIAFFLSPTRIYASVCVDSRVTMCRWARPHACVSTEDGARRVRPGVTYNVNAP